MKIINYIPVILVLGTFIFASCKNKQVVIKNVPDDKLTASLRVEKGDTFAITLPSNPSTGYDWTLKNKDALKKIEYKSKKYVTNSSSQRFMGGGGNDRWFFQALRRGKVYLLFEYKSPSGDLDEQRYYKVEVSKNTSKK